MSRRVRTARGKMIDMAAIGAKYEHTKAVGNVSMNARGDRLNPDGSVKVSAEQVARTHHNIKTPPQDTAISNPKPIAPEPMQPKPVAEPAVQQEPIEDPFIEESAPEPVSRITKTRDDGSKYVEIEYDDGSIETLEINEE